jgi:hypothetical protein
LTNTVEAFLGLQNMTPFATRSWSSVHRSLSSALLLGILGEHYRNERARSLLANLVQVLTDITANVDPAELSAPITRSVAALQRLLSLPNPRAGLPNTASDQGSQSSPTLTTFTAEELNAAFNFEDPAFNQSPLVGLDIDSSPYALMESIVWGSRKSP